MIRLKTVSQMAMDLYYQNYKADDSFFDLPHFQFMLATTYNTILDEEFKLEKLKKKASEGFSFVEFSPEWLITDTVKAQREGSQYFVELPQDIFSFSYDAMGSGVQFVTPIAGSPCNDFIRTTQNDVRGICFQPYTEKVYFYSKGTRRVYFANVNCKLTDVEISYIPAVDWQNDNARISEDKVEELLPRVLNTMFGAKSGNIVDMSNDSNPNTAPVTELNPDSLKQ